MQKRNKYTISMMILGLVLVPAVAIAQTLTGPTYQVEDSIFDSGADSSNSANYQSRDSVGGIETGDSSSTNYKTVDGFQPGAYPGVPAQPTLTNTGGNLYNALDFIIATGDGQQSDTVYAIAISSDDFVTTNFIQIDGTVGTNAAWQSYAGWGSSTGERVTGLAGNTTYKIKVKARYGADSESGYSLDASATTTGPTLIFSISGVSSGQTIAGQTTTATSTATSMGYSSLTVGDGSPNVAAQAITVTTNATGGYTTTVQQNNNLRSSAADEIATVSGTNALPLAFGSGVTTGRFGYHTTDDSLCTGNSTRFFLEDTYAALDTAPFEVACSEGAVTNEVTHLVYKLVIGPLQPAGDYQNTLTYITTATY